MNATPISLAGDWLSITVNANTANELLEADFGVYTHSKTGKKTVRTLNYSVATEVDESIDFIDAAM